MARKPNTQKNYQKTIKICRLSRISRKKFMQLKAKLLNKLRKKFYEERRVEKS
jgi:hypothetical protein